MSIIAVDKVFKTINLRKNYTNNNQSKLEKSSHLPTLFFFSACYRKHTYFLAGLITISSVSGFTAWYIQKKETKHFHYESPRTQGFHNIDRSIFAHSNYTTRFVV
jgi:hypothetical protein